MSGGVLQPYAFANLAMHAVVAVDYIGQPGLDHRQHRISIGLAGVGLMRLRARQLDFVAAHHVACVGKGGHPLPFPQARIPSHMICVQMRAQHEMDIFGLAACAGVSMSTLRP